MTMIINNQPNKTVAIIGRPNVGKSTLFNRLIGQRRAIETPIAGTTRDRLYGEVLWREKTFNLIDVAGVEFGTKNEISRSAQEGVNVAIESANLILFMVDSTETDNEIDRAIARKLRIIKKPVILVANKADNPERVRDIDKFKRLGNFPMIAVSAISGKSTGDLLDIITETLAKGRSPLAKEKLKEGMDTNNSADAVINLAIIGRPNVGKSTLLNTILGEKRAVVSPEPGTTRDAFNASLRHKGKKIEIVDTAGIRRRGKIVKDSIESFSVLRAWRALRDSDVAIFVIDADEGLVAGDAHLIGQAKEWGKGVIVAVNKVDLFKAGLEQAMPSYLQTLQKKLNFVPWIPVVFISAKDQTNIKPLLNQVLGAAANRQAIIDQNDLDRILEHVKESNQQLYFLRSLKQKKTAPPTFEVKFSGKTPPHQTQIRYLENKIRDVFPLNGTPIFIDLKH